MKVVFLRCAIAIACTPFVADAQAHKARRSAYTLERYDEDWSLLLAGETIRAGQSRECSTKYHYGSGQRRERKSRRECIVERERGRCFLCASPGAGKRDGYQRP